MESRGHTICFACKEKALIQQEFTMSDKESQSTETDVEVEMEDLDTEQDDNETVLKLSYDGEELEVTRAAKKSMIVAIDASANQPTYFFKCRFVITVVCDILKLDIVQYSFPTEDDDTPAFDWNEAVPGRTETYPVAKQPTAEEFAMVQMVYNEVVNKKDKIARKKFSMPKLGCQSYKTFKQKWSSSRRYASKRDW